MDPTNAFDRALLAGARLTAAMRLAVEHELGFTVSAGIASNKVLAKLASSRNKPNKQVNSCTGAASLEQGVSVCGVMRIFFSSLRSKT